MWHLLVIPCHVKSKEMALYGMLKCQRLTVPSVFLINPSNRSELLKYKHQEKNPALLCLLPVSL